MGDSNETTEVLSWFYDLETKKQNKRQARCDTQRRECELVIHWRVVTAQPASRNLGTVRALGGGEEVLIFARTTVSH